MTNEDQLIDERLAALSDEDREKLRTFAVAELNLARCIATDHYRAYAVSKLGVDPKSGRVVGVHPDGTPRCGLFGRRLSARDVVRELKQEHPSMFEGDQ